MLSGSATPWPGGSVPRAPRRGLPSPGFDGVSNRPRPPRRPAEETGSGHAVPVRQAEARLAALQRPRRALLPHDESAGAAAATRLALATVRPPPPEAVAGLPLELLPRPSADPSGDPSPSPLTGTARAVPLLLGDRPRADRGRRRRRRGVPGRTRSSSSGSTCCLPRRRRGRRRGLVRGRRVGLAPPLAGAARATVDVGQPPGCGGQGALRAGFAPLVDRVWVVSEADRRAMRRVVGPAKVDVIPNGVDSDHFRPRDRHRERADLRLLGPPRLRAEHPGAGVVLQRVWPLLRRSPDARSRSTASTRRTVRRLAGRDGIDAGRRPAGPPRRGRPAPGRRPAVRQRRRDQEQAARGGEPGHGDRRLPSALNGLSQPKQIPLVCVKNESAWVRRHS